MLITEKYNKRLSDVFRQQTSKCIKEVADSIDLTNHSIHSTAYTLQLS